MATPAPHPARTARTDLIVLAVVAVAATLPFWLSDLDLRAGALFYRPVADGDSWPLAAQPLWLALYHGIPIVTGVVSVLALLTLAVAAFRPQVGRWRPYAAMVLLTVVLGPGLLVNAFFKDNWGRPRPRQTIELGGTQPYVPPLMPRFGAAGKSFPCGHCSVGFALAAGWYLFRSHLPWVGRAFLLLALAAGTLTGASRMAAGGHFLSDVMWSGILTFFAAWLSYYVVLRVPRWQRRLAQAPPRASPRPWVEGGAYAAVAVLLVGGSLVATPMDLTVDLEQPLEPLPAELRGLQIEAGRADIEIILAASGDTSIRARGRLQGFGLPTNRMSAQFLPPTPERPTLSLRVETTGFYKELSGRITVSVPTDRFGIIEVRVARGDIRVSRQATTTALPELRLEAPRGRIEQP